MKNGSTDRLHLGVIPSERWEHENVPEGIQYTLFTVIFGCERNLFFQQSYHDSNLEGSDLVRK
jgi:hypothetical protein